MKKKGKCAKCGTREQITRHHILPKVHFHGSGGMLYLCRGCHDEIEKSYAIAERLFGHTVDYHERKRLTVLQYKELTIKFLES